MARHQGDEDAYGSSASTVLSTENQAPMPTPIWRLPRGSELQRRLQERNRRAQAKPDERSEQRQSPHRGLTMRPRSVQGGPGTGPVRRTHPTGPARDGRPPRFQRPCAHEPRVNRADDSGPPLSEFENGQWRSPTCASPSGVLRAGQTRKLAEQA